MRNARAVLLSFLLALALHAPTNAQSGFQEFSVMQWTIREGLPQSTVQDIEQTGDGYLWLATEGGLARFDGITFKVFDTDNTRSLKSNRINVLFEDRYGTLWIGTERGLVSHRNGRFKSHAEDLGVPNTRVDLHGIAQDAHGTLWLAVGSGSRRVVTFSDGTFRAPTFSGDSVAMDLLREVTQVFTDNEDRVWLRTPASLLLVEGNRLRAYEPKDGVPMLSQKYLRRQGRGYLPILSGDGRNEIIRFNEGKFSTVPFLENDPRPTEAYQVDSRGLIWAATSRRGIQLYASDSVMATYLMEESSTLNVLKLFEDREGNVWAGTDRGGLFRFKPHLFQVYGSSAGLTNDVVRSLAVVGKDSILINPVCNGPTYRPALLHDGRLEPFLPQGPELFPCVNTLYGDDDGSIWLGGSDLHHAERGRLSTYALGIPMWGIYEDPAHDGRFWLGTYEGAFRFENGSFTRVPMSKEGVADHVFTFLRDHTGTLWAAGQGMLCTYSTEKSGFVCLSQEDGIPPLALRTLLEDPAEAGVIWIGSYGGGLLRYKDGELTQITRREGLFENVVSSLLVDDRGDLWMSGNRGIFRVPLAEVRAFADDEIGRIRSVGYGMAEGLVNPETNGGNQPSAVQTADGRLWYPTFGGVAVVDPAQIDADTLAPAVVVEEVLFHNEPVPTAGGVRFAPGERSFQINYTGISLSAPTKVRFQYRLAGLEEEWVEAGTRRNVFYANVPPGRYTFELHAANRDGVWTKSATTLSIVVAPHYYETTWFWLVVAFGVLATLVTAYRARMGYLRRRERELEEVVAQRTRELQDEKRTSDVARADAERQRNRARDALQTIAEQAEKLRELNEAKTRFFANITHEFRTPLTLIMGPLNRMLSGSQGELPESVQRTHEMMLRNARRLLHLINQILDLERLKVGTLEYKPRPKDLAELISATARGFAPLAEQQGITLRYHGPTTQCIVALDVAHAEKIFSNLLSNAIKFTPRGGSVDVVLDADTREAEIRIEDTGIGIHESDLAHVFDRFYQVNQADTYAYEGTGIGLSLVKELVLLHEGSIDAQSMVGEGTTFTVRLPLLDHAPSGDRRIGSGDGAATFTEAGDETSGAFTRAETSAAKTGAALTAAAETTADEMAAGETTDAPTPVATTEDDAVDDKTTVLVIDDNADVRMYVRSILMPTYHVVEAGDGREGLERAQELLPDLIVADVMMPELDGFALSRAMKEDPALDCIPLIMLTARATTEDAMEGLLTGADDYVTKPFEPELLWTRVGNLIEQRRRLRDRLRQELGISKDEPAEIDPRGPLEKAVRSVVTERLTEEGFTVQDLASELAMSYSKLYQDLKDEADRTPTEMVRTVRLDHAVRLLEEHRGSVAEVAYAVGFQSRSYFTRCFTSHFGMSPTEYISNL